MKNYIDKEQKAKDVKSTGYTFCLVGFLGAVFLILMNLNVLHFSIESSQRILITVVMGIVFAIFLVIGFISFHQSKQLTLEGADQKDTEDQLLKDFMEKYADRLHSLGEGEEDSEELYFLRNREIIDILKSDNPEISEEDADHLSEVLYEKIFDSNTEKE